MYAIISWTFSARVLSEDVIGPWQEEEEKRLVLAVLAFLPPPQTKTLSPSPLTNASYISPPAPEAKSDAVEEPADRAVEGVEKPKPTQNYKSSHPWKNISTLVPGRWDSFSDLMPRHPTHTHHFTC